MITHHTQLLQALIDKHGLKSYLEIGVQNPANNFDKIRCEKKTGVDPNISNEYVFYKLTSDIYFELYDDSFDLIFIDGDHSAEQVKRDFENSLRCLSDNGFIVIHDVLPENEEGTLVPRQTKRWWGDVYKFCMTLPGYIGIRFVTYNIDEGCMLVWKDKEVNPQGYKFEPTWENYKSVGRVILNVVDEVII